MKLMEIYKELIQEVISGKNHGFDVLLPFVEDKLNISVKKYIASGTKSDIFELTNGKILKLTHGKNDANGMMFAKEHPQYPIIKVFEIYKIQEPNLPTKIVNLYGNVIFLMISEKIKTSSFTLDDEAVLEDWFLNNTKYVPDDIHPDNMGINSKNEIIYIDPSFENIENYISKIPVLK